MTEPTEAVKLGVFTILRTSSSLSHCCCGIHTNFLYSSTSQPPIQPVMQDSNLDSDEELGTLV